MKTKGKTNYPEKGDKFWRELTPEDRAMSKGSSGRIVKIDFSVDPREYIVVFPAPTSEGGMVSRESFTLEEIDGWTDSYGGTWYKGNLP